MSGYINGKFVIQQESEETCEYCGKKSETRPYGKNGARICFGCAMKNEDETRENFGLLLNGAPNKNS